MNSIHVVTFVIELPFDLGIRDQTGGLLYEKRGSQWDGWSDDAINQVLELPKGQEMKGELGRGTRWMIRRGWLKVPPPLLASDQIFGDWVEEILSKKERRRRRRGIQRQRRRGMDKPVTAVALSRFVGPDQVPEGPDDDRAKPLYDLVRADFNRILTLYGLVSGHWWIQPVMDRDLVGYVPVLTELAGPHTPDERGRVVRQGRTFTSQIHDSLPNLVDQEFIRQEDLLRTAALVGSANRGELPFLPVFEMAHEAGGNLNAGRTSLAVVLSTSAVELLVAILIREGGPLCGFSPESQGKAERASFRNSIEHHLPKILGEDIDLDGGASPWNDWWHSAYEVRNEFVHGAELPTKEVALEAWAAFDELIHHVQARLASDPKLKSLHDGMPFKLDTGKR